MIAVILQAADSFRVFPHVQPFVEPIPIWAVILFLMACMVGGFVAGVMRKAPQPLVWGLGALVFGFLGWILVRFAFSARWIG